MIMKQQKKKKGRAVQELLGIRTFTKYGLSTNKGELIFYLVSPTNISVLSHPNIEIKIRHLMILLLSLIHIFSQAQSTASIKAINSSIPTPPTQTAVLRPNTISAATIGRFVRSAPPRDI